MKKSKVFKLYENCKLVKGNSRSLICDLQRDSFSFIPNDLYDLIILNEEKTIDEVKKYYNNEYDEVIEEYFEFLISNEYVFLTDTPDWFPKLSLEYHYPFEISNAIIDINTDSKYDIYKALNELEKVYCKFLEIRFYDKTEIEFLNTLFLYLENKKSIITSVNVVIPYTELIDLDLESLINRFLRLSSVTLTSSSKNKIELLKDNTNRYKLYTIDDFEDERCCGIINKSFFVSNINLFTESLNHNSCLNRKISIDINGNIKNCPSMSQSFGNIKDTTLQEALENPDFKKYWNITKDQIDVCKDCEFRYVCTDCRAYKENPEDDYSKPLKCGYSPYTNKWEKWSTNPLKQKAIEYYNMQELVKKND